MLLPCHAVLPIFVKHPVPPGRHERLFPFSCHTDHLLPHSSYAGLRSLDLTDNLLHTIPAELACTALTSLCVGANVGLHLTRKQMASLLGRLPRLIELRDRDTAIDQAVRDYAAQALSLRAS